MSNYFASEKAAIHQLVRDLEKSWNAHDARLYASAFSEDAEFTTVFGQINRGRQTIEQGHATVFSTVFKNSIIGITETSVRFIKPDVASVDIRWAMKGASLSDDNVSKERRGILNWLLVRQDAEWKIVVAHNAELPETPVRLKQVLQNQ